MLKLTTTVNKILPSSRGETESKPWVRHSILLNAGNDKYPKILLVNTFKDEIFEIIKGLEQGQAAEFTIDMFSKEFRENYYTNVNVIRVDPIADFKSSTNVYVNDHYKKVEEQASLGLTDDFDVESLELPF